MVVISAYFSGSETGMMTLNRYRLRHMAKQGNRSAKRVEKLLRKPDRLISLVLIGNNLVNILASALGTIVGMRLYGDAGVAIATGVLTFVVLVFAEVLPKTIAALYPEKVAYPSSFLLAPLQILMMPLVWLLNAITRMLMRMMGIKTDIVVSGSLSKEELRTIVHESRSQISRRNQDMLLSVLDLEKMTVDDIMVPRSEIIGIDINDDWKSILRQLSHSPHGRIVLYRDSLDDAISMLRVREAWRLMSEKKEFTKETMLRAADEIYFVLEGTPLSTQLVKFQRNKKKVGLVVNEYGDIQGLVTVEDILEEIVGDFTTSMSPTLAEEVTPQNDGSVIIDGTANVREINKAFNWHLPEDDARTVNGVILEALEEIPVAGTRVRIGEYDIDILDVQDNMIKQVKVFPVKPLRECGGVKKRPGIRMLDRDLLRKQKLSFCLRYSHHRRTNCTTVQRITLLHNAQYVTWRNVIRFHHCDGLMHIRVQWYVSFGDHFNAKLTHNIQHRLQRQLNTFNHRGHIRVSFISHFQRTIQAINHRQQFVDEFLQREFVSFFNIQFSTTTQVFHFGFYAQNAVTFTGLGFSQLSFEIRNFFIARIHLLSRSFWLNCLNLFVLIHDNFFRGLPSGVFCSLLLMNFSAFFSHSSR